MKLSRLFLLVSSLAIQCGNCLPLGIVESDNNSTKFLPRFASVSGETEKVPLPVVIWHGMGDTCCLPTSMGWVKKKIEDGVPGVYVISLMIGSNIPEDQYNGFLMPIARQLEFACNLVTVDAKLQGGFHAVGFSQGGLFLRTLAQTCPGAKIANLISIGGPQQGVFGVPACTSPNSTLCEIMRQLLEIGAYVPLVQERLVQAQYWHDPETSKYIKGNIFLPDINNYAPTKNATFAKRLAAINSLVLVKFMNDTVVVPRESEWFEFYDSTGKKVVPLRDSPLYQQDWLGLKALDETGRLILLESPGDHLAMPKGWFEKNIIPLLAQGMV